MTDEQTKRHEAFRELLNCVRQCERNERLQDRLNMAAAIEAKRENGH